MNVLHAVLNAVLRIWRSGCHANMAVVCIRSHDSHFLRSLSGASCPSSPPVKTPTPIEVEKKYTSQFVDVASGLVFSSFPGGNRRRYALFGVFETRVDAADYDIRNVHFYTQAVVTGAWEDRLTCAAIAKSADNDGIV